MMKRDTGLGVSMMNLMRDDTFLGDIMRERDNFFHPFQGL